MRDSKLRSALWDALTRALQCMAALPDQPAISDAQLDGRETVAIQRSGVATLHSFNCSAAPAPPPPPLLLPPLAHSLIRSTVAHHARASVMCRSVLRPA